MSDDRFGYSLALDDGDLLLQTDNSGGVSFAEVRGTRNLLQALTLRVLTPFGSDIFNVTYGFDYKQAFTQPGNLRHVKELIKLNLVRTLGTDRRVREIRDIYFQDDAEYLERHPELSEETLRQYRRKRFWQVEATMETINSEIETLSIRIGV